MLRRALALSITAPIALLIACGGGTETIGPPADAGPAPDAGVVDTGTGIDASAPDAKEASVDTSVKEALYAGICVTALANRDPEQAFRFYTEVKLASSGATFELRLTPLKGWDFTVNPPSGKYVDPASISKSETRGSKVSANDVPLEQYQQDASTPKDHFTAKLGTLNLAGEANSISGRDAIIESLELEGVLSLKSGGLPERFCSTFAGKLTAPYIVELKADKNTCVFVKVSEGAALPVLAYNEFVCPF